MEYLNQLFQKWMPSNTRVATNSDPRLHGIFDTINSTLATTDLQTRLPEEFYDARARQIIDCITVEEEFSGYKESQEYRTVGIGGLLGEVVERMMCNIPDSKGYSGVAFDSNEGDRRESDDEGYRPKFVICGAHDSTLAAILASLGAMEGENGSWPSFTSSLAVELFSEIEPEEQQRNPFSVTTNSLSKSKDGRQQQGEGQPLECSGGGVLNQLIY